jgi:RHS repeat-associated protein
LQKIRTQPERDHAEIFFSAVETPQGESARGVFLYVKENHLGNVLVTVSDRKLGVDNNTDGIVEYYTADVLTSQDYYSFGMVQPGRSFNSSDSRYGFQGQEKDPEIAEGIYTAEYWEYDSRLARRWNTDPLPQASWSPYSVLNCNPFMYEDMAGDTPTVREAALMSNHVYADPANPVTLEGGWEVAPRSDAPAGFVFEDKESGFKSQLYRRQLGDGTFEYNYAYAGTEEIFDDGNADASQAVGNSRQYDLAYNNSIKLSQHLKSKELTFTGHSLGGGLATISALATQRNAITFNPAQLSVATINKYHLNPHEGYRVNNYIVAGEILNASQTLFGPPLFVKIGTNHFLFSPIVGNGMATGWGTVEGHMMGTVMDALKYYPQINRSKGTLQYRAPGGALLK